MTNSSQDHIVAVVQARLCSKRLPYKMMLCLNGYPIIEWVVRRAQTAKLIHDIIVAIPDRREDDILATYLARLPIDIYRGSEEDVLSRVFHAAEKKKATHVVRICADNPLICGGEIDNLIRHYKNHPCDYAYNHIPKQNRYPDGMGAEMVSFQLLKNIENTVTDPFQREHCLMHISENADRFSIQTFDPPNPKLWHPELRLDIDTIDDYRALALKQVKIDSTAERIIDLFQKDHEPNRTV